ncbi:hypothetical protein D1815_05440 [Aquimarina sp. AD1]|uniref:aspartyl protease family protein n=1 Tax=Aquimarina sp. (strain AD1) TaxID=1714848 RepID=UPI000E529EC5|nr:aspartyl protease family protein [Aquimarina sp. AD1]AXT55226.1 hypothetical protein D1815_05440 [Aquimarina sp. AD1]
MKTYFTITLILFPLIIFGQDKPIDQIPFTINDSGLIIISLKINKVMVSDFVMDTGASVTVIDNSVVNQLGLPLQDQPTQITGASAVNNDIRKTQKQRVSLSNNIVLKNLEMYVSDLSRLADIKGIIGYDIFKNYVTETNFDTKTIYFYKRKGKPDTKGYKSIPFTEAFCTPEIDISVLLSNNESLSGKVLFDTGNVASPFIFNEPFTSKLNMVSKFEKLIIKESEGINSKDKTKQGIVKNIKIDNYTFSEIPVSLSKSKKGMLSKEAYMGILGLEFISKFNFILNYKKKKIYLKPNKSFKDRFDFPLSGIILKSKRKSIFIKSIYQPSMAYDKGLRAGQQLISIDGIKEKDKQFYQKALRSEDKVVSITVQLEDGTLKTVQILLKRLI